MAKQKLNSNLQRAKKKKNDEFYTRNTDIENELKYYRDQFRNKIIYCNCDDPVESEFYRYFHLNFHFFGLRLLISTHYDAKKPTYALIYQGGSCEESDNDYNSYDKKIPLKENGDFRSDESIAYLEQSDIVVTNPPFSLYREYVAQLMKYHKKFIIIGNKNSITYKEIFPLLMSNQMWEGVNSVKEFIQPDGSIKKLGNVGWFTNMPVNKPTDRVILWNHYTPEEFPTYDNFAGFECSKLAHLPIDKEIDTWIDNNRLAEFKSVYKDDLSIKEEKANKTLVHIKRPIFGVPITFIDKYNPSKIGGVETTGSAWQTSSISSVTKTRLTFPEDEATSMARESTAESLYDRDNLAKKFIIIGLDRYTVPKNKLIGGRVAINGKPKYARILIRYRNLI